MKRALIDPRFNRVCSVRESSGEFPVAQPLFWMDCADDVDDHTHEWVNGVIVEIQRPAPQDPSDLDRVEKAIKALAMVVAELHSMTPAQMRQAFRQKWQQLP